MKKRLWLLGVILVWGLAPLIWFKPGLLVITPDLAMPHTPASWWRLASTWDASWNAGVPSTTWIAHLGFAGLPALFQAFGATMVWAEMASFLFWFSLPGFAMFYLISGLFPRRPFAAGTLVAVNFYLFNLFVEANWLGNRGPIVAYATVPLLLGLLVRGGLSPSWKKYACAFGLVTLLGGEAAMNPPVAVVVGIALLLWALGWFLAASRLNRAKLRRRLPKFLGLSLAVAAGVNAYWLLPRMVELSIHTSSGYFGGLRSDFISWLEGLSASTSLWNVLRLQGSWDFYGHWQEPFRVYSGLYQGPLWQVLSIMVPSLLLVGIWRDRSSWRLPAVLLTLFGLIFSCGIHPPFRGFYLWMFDHVPGFWMFRSPWYKFSLWTCIGYAYFLGIAGQAAYELITQSRLAHLRRRWITVFQTAGISLVAVMLTTQMLYAFPVITGELYPTAAERQVLKPFRFQLSDDVRQTARWLQGQPNQGRVLLLPRTKDGISTYRWGLMDNVPALARFTERPLLFETKPLAFEDRAAAILKIATDALYGQTVGDPVSLFGLLGARYGVHQRDAQYDYFEANEREAPEAIQGHLRRAGLKQAATFGLWDVYEFPPTSSWHLMEKMTLVFGSLESLAGLSALGPLEDEAVVFADQQEPEMVRRLLGHAAVGRLVFFEKPLQGTEIETILTKRRMEVFMMARAGAMDAVVEPSSDPELPTWALQRETFYDELETIEQARWRWFKKSGENHVVIHNPYPIPVAMNLSFTAYSLREDRTFQVLLNGSPIYDLLVTQPQLPKNRPTLYVAKNIPLQPGDNAIGFYTPNSWESRDGHLISIAIREDVQVGNLQFERTFEFPRDGLYEFKALLPGGRTGSEIFLQAIDGSLTPVAAAPVQLSKGSYRVIVKQSTPGESPWVAIRSLADAPLEALPPRELSVKSKNHTSFEVALSAQKDGLLCMKSSYHPFWQWSGSPPGARHLIVNGYANGWWIPAGTGQALICYGLEKIFHLAVAVSVLTFVLIMGGWLWRIRRTTK